MSGQLPATLLQTALSLVTADHMTRRGEMSREENLDLLVGTLNAIESTSDLLALVMSLSGIAASLATGLAVAESKPVEDILQIIGTALAEGGDL